MKQIYVFAAYLFCVLIWGSNAFLVKVQSAGGDSWSFLLLRLMFAAAILLMVCWIFNKKIYFPLRLEWSSLAFGVFNFSLNYWLIYEASLLLSAAYVMLIFSTKTFFTPLVLSYYKKEKLSTTFYVSCLLCALGIYLALSAQLTTNILQSSGLLAIGLAFLGTFLTSLGDLFSFILQKKQQASKIDNNFNGHLYGAVFLFLVGCGRPSASTLDFTYPVWLAFAVLTVCSSVVAWLLYLYLVEKIGAEKSSLMVAFFPSVALLEAYFFQDFTIHFSTFVGIILSCVACVYALSKNLYVKNSKKK